VRACVRLSFFIKTTTKATKQNKSAVKLPLCAIKKKGPQQHNSNNNETRVLSLSRVVPARSSFLLLLPLPETQLRETRQE